MDKAWIWQQPDWPSFCWDERALRTGLWNAHAQRQALAERLLGLDEGLGREALAALLSRDSLGMAAIEGEQLDPAEVRSSLARRLQLPLEDPQPRSSAQVDGLLQVLFAATDALEDPLSLDTLNQWHADLFAAGPDGLRAIGIGCLRGRLPMQVLSGAMGREQLHFEAPARDGLEQRIQAFLAWFNQPQTDLDGLIPAGLAHLWFITLHPYVDGNGRLARSITDRALAQSDGGSGLPARALGLSARRAFRAA